MGTAGGNDSSFTRPSAKLLARKDLHTSFHDTRRGGLQALSTVSILLKRQYRLSKQNEALSSHAVGAMNTGEITMVQLLACARSQLY